MTIAPAFADTKNYIFQNWIDSPRPRPRSKPQLIQIVLMGPINHDLYLVQPLHLNVEQDQDGTFVVSDDIFLVYGNANNPSKAIEDYVTSLVEFYYLLQRGSAVNPFDHEQFAYLQTYIQTEDPRVKNALQTTRD